MTRKPFKPPTASEAIEFANSIGYTTFNYLKWYHHYNSQGWMVGKTKMKRWKSAIWTWFLPSAEYKAIQARKKAAEDKAKGRQTERDKIRDEYGPWLRDKTAEGLLDLKKDSGHIVNIAGFLIDEILAERRALKANHER